MKQKPETRPNAEILERFLAWSKILKKPISDSVYIAMQLYQNYDSNYVPDNFVHEGKWKTFSFEIDMEKWERFKRHAVKRWWQNRDDALTSAMSLFIEHYDNLLKGAL